MPNRAQPLCSAAATAALIDVDKGVRPCCAYVGDHGSGVSVGHLDRASLRSILEGEEWQRIRTQLANHEVPAGCVDCVGRERLVGWSERLTVEQRRSPNWDRGLTYLELDSSNLCNLQCRHCNSMYSSRWAKHQARMGRGDSPVVLPDNELLLKNLRDLDLGYLETVSLKGGEPMLNSDMLTLLQHLDEIGVIGNVHFHMVTNGTVITPSLLELLRKGKRRSITVSVDGVGPVQTYIRHGGSENEKLERAIATYAAMPDTQITRNTSVMAYNVFSLDRIDAWWHSLAGRFPGDYPDVFYGLFVMHPPHMAVSVLQDHTRAALRDKYTALDPVRYEPVIRALNLPFAGAERHDEFVDYTRRLDGELGRSVLDAIPELESELVHLVPSAPPRAIADATPNRTPSASVVGSTLASLWASITAGDLQAARRVADETAAWLAGPLPSALRAALLHAQGVLTALAGQPAAGLVFLDDALTLLPRHAGIRLHRARILESMGRRDDAIADAKAAAQDSNCADEARSLLARCAAN